MKSGKKWGYNLFGYVTGSFGQALATRTTMNVLLGRGEGICYRDISRLEGRSTTMPEHPELECRSSRALPYAVNLIHANPPDLLRRLHTVWSLLRPERCFNVMVPFWELPLLPEVWRRGLAMMDAVMAPSRYIEQTILAEVPGVPVLHYPQAVYLPEGIAANRARWGISADEIVFFVSFDVTSDIERKNPWAAMNAFRMAFEQDSGAVLLIKLNAQHADRDQLHHIDRLRSVIADRTDMRIVDSHLAYADLLSLYASCDVLVSLHRAEGLGLVLMEAMTLAKPVIVTAWSGNMDFTTPQNSCLVPFELVPVQGSHPAYDLRLFDKTPLWAEPDTKEAAKWMRTLAQDSNLRNSIGTHAASDMAMLRQTCSEGRAFDVLRTLYDSDDAQAAHMEHARALKKDRRWGWVGLAVRVPRYVVKRIGRAIDLARR
ncbi:MAG: glycosyltransferase [Coriobacteriia bacterium]|nr:glycosyltransferase [Coriobacteriia bacterium]